MKQDQLHISFNYLFNITEVVGDALILTDNQDKIIQINSGALRMVGYQQEEIIGQNISLIMPEVTQSGSRLGKAEGWEGCWLSKSGESISVFCSSSSVSSGRDNIFYTVYVARDITLIKRAEEQLQETYVELKKTQEELIQSEKLAAIGRLARGIAHELRNPLTIILQGVALIEAAFPEKTEELKEIIDIIKNSVERSDNIITRLLEYARASRLIIRPQNICEIIDKGISFIAHQAMVHNIIVEKNYPSDLILVNADKITLAQVFLNLAMNAIDAMPEGGKIIINVSCRKNMCVIEFKDTGCGILAENITKIFEPFFTSKAPDRGIGLGLAMVHLIIQRHKGIITVDSKLNEGTVFTIKLPWLSEEEFQQWAASSQFDE